MSLGRVGAKALPRRVHEAAARTRGHQGSVVWICCAHRIERGRAQLAGGGGGEGTHTEDAMHQTWGAMAEHGDLFFHWFLKAHLYSKQGGHYYSTELP